MVLAVTGSIGLAALFFCSLVAMLAALENRKWGWFVGIAMTWPVASTFYSLQLKEEHRWLLKMLMTGWLLLAPMLLFIVMLLIE